MNEIKIELRKEEDFGSNHQVSNKIVAYIRSKDNDVRLGLWCDKLTIIGLDRNITSFELKRK
jgi:hypothetical protein